MLTENCNNKYWRKYFENCRSLIVKKLAFRSKIPFKNKTILLGLTFHSFREVNIPSPPYFHQ